MNPVFAIIDKRAPQAAKQRLAKEFVVVEFITENITYEAIAGHPDVFITQSNNCFVISPDTPKPVVDALNSKKTKYVFGESRIGTGLNNSSQYNCIINENYIFHRKGFTDKTILDTHPNHQCIHLPQSYTRCSAIDLGQFILTSDKGIETALIKQNILVEYVSPQGILLPPYKNGFIGGCYGVFNNKLYIIGHIDCFHDKERLLSIIDKSGLEPVYLYDGDFYDGGGIFFIE